MTEIDKPVTLEDDLISKKDEEGSGNMLKSI